MKSRITAQFRKGFARLPEQVQEQTREAYCQFKQDSGQPCLRFKKVHPELPIYSARRNHSILLWRDDYNRDRQLLRELHLWEGAKGDRSRGNNPGRLLQDSPLIREY